MYREPENPTYAYVDAFVEELARAGMQHVVISPGSRSTPLAYSFARNGNIKVWMQYDERSGAFFALGMAKASRKPVALVCTSGTAAANYFPAITEAQLSRVPLLVLTADRPPELRNNGAPQAIDQLKIYGDYVKLFVEAALPEASEDMLRYARTIAGRAFGTALAKPSGAVHINFPFREPLIPAPIPGQPLPAVEKRNLEAWQGRAGAKTYVTLSQAPRRLAKPELGNLAQTLSSQQRGVIICGAIDEPELSEQLVKLAETLQFPILADPLSGLRTGSHDKNLIIDNYDAFLRDEAIVAGFAPSMVLRFGAMPTAKPVLLWLKRFSECPQIVVDSGDGWQEPTMLATEIIHADPTLLCRDLCMQLADSQSTTENSWLSGWLEASHLAHETVQAIMGELDEPFEGKIFTELRELLPEGAILFSSNSMPVRDMDTFFSSTDRNIRLMCNRGANGIDGVVSSALGAGAVTSAPLTLVIGDLSFYHDMNGLLAAKLHQLNATIILINNDGGGIFSFLPQASYPENFELLFGTPHGLDFRHVAALYGAEYTLSTNWHTFREAVSSSFAKPGLKIIEIPTTRAQNVIQHRRFWGPIAERIKAGVWSRL
ncbi:MAG: 2-succinyl-5-enolpyruvyl-6-hydroxy-3-cyclohexene-1-carboxylic-acid synthase [Chloroflexi bacterium]|uniref:2-succinyl-5-enolpyruvyl-6-hydroxy-3-cyclohexene-1-carboxylate synthase n=1 Tax=Candidatus Chlorohelix allophototropha TaxID=3003348 RepID=A0A8T7M7N4_9CHLR|nr:2-succinyl-5-enolpyruvyl-6-hydroxy-3-cyclohexene-1-carboxylic-acid synthase [Chloroflexota bacterium]WJW68035.1 2-succinyl-5-enolpyruvyl-6-hydroxy-3-cyclohexene-1-carboxylic-acid synthase [Chloroflexota bacterium L227-S17]